MKNNNQESALKKLRPDNVEKFNGGLFDFNNGKNQNKPDYSDIGASPNKLPERYGIVGCRLENLKDCLQNDIFILWNFEVCLDEKDGDKLNASIVKDPIFGLRSQTDRIKNELNDLQIAEFRLQAFFENRRGIMERETPLHVLSVIFEFFWIKCKIINLGADLNIVSSYASLGNNLLCTALRLLSDLYSGEMVKTIDELSYSNNGKKDLSIDDLTKIVKKSREQFFKYFVWIAVVLYRENKIGVKSLIDYLITNHILVPKVEKELSNRIKPEIERDIEILKDIVQSFLNSYQKLFEALNSCYNNYNDEVYRYARFIYSFIDDVNKCCQSFKDVLKKLLNLNKPIECLHLCSEMAENLSMVNEQIENVSGKENGWRDVFVRRVYKVMFDCLKNYRKLHDGCSEGYRALLSVWENHNNVVESDEGKVWEYFGCPKENNECLTELKDETKVSEWLSLLRKNCLAYDIKCKATEYYKKLRICMITPSSKTALIAIYRLNLMNAEDISKVWRFQFDQHKIEISNSNKIILSLDSSFLKIAQMMNLDNPTIAFNITLLLLGVEQYYADSISVVNDK